MRVLMVHNAYRQFGGEDVVFENECRLLERHGHEVFRHHVSNRGLGRVGILTTGIGAPWNAVAYRRLRRRIRQLRPDVLHLHNTFPRLSPAVGYAARAEGVPTVQTLHNYRLLCANSYFHRDGRVCQDCLGRAIPLPAIRHACYRNNRAASASVVLMQSLHRLLRTWHRTVDLFIVLSGFAREQFVKSGLIAADRIVVKWNSVDSDPGVGQGGGGYAVYVGRLSPEKGLDVLLESWKRIGAALPLKIIGGGPMAGHLGERVAGEEGVELLGWRTPDETLKLMKQAELLLVPSLWFEGSPMVIHEALAVGLPVVASALGALPGLVKNGETGCLFPPGDAEALAERVLALRRDEGALSRMRSAARDDFERRFSPAANYESLMSVYRRALERRDRPVPARSGGPEC